MIDKKKLFLSIWLVVVLLVIQTQSVSAGPDVTVPIITPNPITNPFELELVDSYTEGCTATDDDPTYVNDCSVQSGSIDTSVTGLQSVTYQATDPSLNTATLDVTSLIQDTTIPILALVGIDPESVSIATPYVDAGAIVTDNDNTVDGLTILCDATNVFVDTAGSYTVTCDFIDPSGNAATQVTRTVNVVDDAPPEITLFGADPQTIFITDPYVELGAVAIDVNDGDITGSIVIDASAVDTSIAGSYPVTYDVTDSAGNPAPQVTRTVNVVVPTIITLRDITSLDPTPDPIASFDKTEYDPGEIAIVTITDFNGNLNPNEIDEITATFGSEEITLSESAGAENSGSFSTEVAINESTELEYMSDSPQAVRATVTLSLDSETDVTLSDVDVIEGPEFSDIWPKTQRLKISLDEPSALTPDTPVRVTMSYANGLFTDDELSLICNVAKLYYRGYGDLTFPLVAFTENEMHEDSGVTFGAFDTGETVYDDADDSLDVSAGDTRLANAAAQGFSDGSVVASGNADEIAAFSLVGFTENEMHEDSGVMFGVFDVGETVYDDADASLDVSAGDTRLANAAAQGFSNGSVVIDIDGDVGWELAGIPDTDEECNSSTITSDLLTESGNPVTTGQFLIGVSVPPPGGGGGSLVRAGLVVNALGFVKTLAVGGGGGGNSPPSFGQSSFAIISGGEEGFGGILNDNNVNTLEQTKTFKVGEKAVIRIDFTEGGGIGKIEHIKLFTNVRDGQKRQDSDASISYDPLKSPPITVHDPNGLFSEAKFELLQIDAAKFVLKYDLTFAKPMAKSDLILESWNLKKWSTLNKIPNAIEVISSGIVQEVQLEPVETFLEDVTDDTIIPVWVKSNAKWWSDDKIDNDNFISGLEYLVNEGIIKVSLPEGTDNSISEVQPWIKSTAGWWADGMISEDEFITAIEWMITNNIIQVAA